MKKQEELKPRLFFVLALSVVVAIVFTGTVAAQGPKNANPNSPLAQVFGYQAYDNESKQVGTLITFNEDFRATVAVDVEDISGNPRRVMMHLQRPNPITAEAFGNSSALFASGDCTGQPYQSYLAEPSFPALSESHSTTILTATGELEVWFPSTDVPQQVIIGSSLGRNGVCWPDPFPQERSVVPLVLIATDFFSQYPPPYDVR
jgi:hypothetical protein